MKSIGIITIHKINNYGSVLQAFALQKACEFLGNKVEIIDYKFPNQYHLTHKYQSKYDSIPNEPRLIKLFFAWALIRQHRGIGLFVKKYQHLSNRQYNSPKELEIFKPLYDVYMTGSDQIWNPRHCGGDPSFMLHFAVSGSRKISYAASICADHLPQDLNESYCKLLGKYQFISVREKSSVNIIKKITGKEPYTVVDPTLLLSRYQWNEIAIKKRLIKNKFILCYFLNYSFNAFPYVEKLVEYIHKKTKYDIVYVGRPPHHLSFFHTYYRVGASPEEFLSLMRDADMVLTTSFHGTAFAVNYGKPLFTVVQDKNACDSRQVDLMCQLGLEKQILSVGDPMPDISRFQYDASVQQKLLEELRCKSYEYLKTSI